MSSDPIAINNLRLLRAFVACRMLGEMAAANPGIGSFTEYVRLGLGNWGGFVAGWLYWYFWVVVVAVEAIAGASLLQEWLPLPVWQLGLGLMAIMTVTNLLSTRSYGEFEFWFATLKVAAIVILIVIGLSCAAGLTAHRAVRATNLWTHGGFAPKGSLAIFAGVTTVIFSLCGAEIATIAAAESAEPARNIAKMTTSVALRIVLFYVVSMVLILATVPWDAVVPGTSPFATALERIGVPGAAQMMKLIVLTAVLSCLNSGIYVTSRVVFTLAAHADAPQWLVRLNRRKVPARAVTFGVLFGYVAVIFSVVSPQTVFAFLVNASGATMLIIYVMVAAAQIKLRQAATLQGNPPVTVKMWLFPWLSYLIVAAILAVLVAMLAHPDTAGQLYASLFGLLVVTVLYVLLRRHKSQQEPEVGGFSVDGRAPGGQQH